MSLTPLEEVMLAALKAALPYAERVAAMSPTQPAGMQRQRQALKDVDAVRTAIKRVEAAAAEPRGTSEIEGPVTLRKLCTLLGGAFLDAHITVSVEDSHRNHAACFMPSSLYGMPRSVADSMSPAFLTLRVSLDKHRLVKASK